LGLRFGFDIGGTNTKIGVYQDLTLIDSYLYPTNLDTVKKNIEKLIEKHNKPEFIGFSFAGQVVDGKISSTQYVKGKELLNIDINQWCQEHFQTPSAIDNDLNCAAIAEYQALLVKDLAVFYIGTGFGSAFISDGLLVRGSDNLAGEIGHIPFKKANFKCQCGGNRCVELFVSGHGLKKWCKTLKSKEHTLLSMKNHKKLDSVYKNFLKGFSHTLLTANALFNPEKFVLGGGVVKGNPWLVDFANNVLQSKGFSPSRGRKAVLSLLDEFAQTLGAIYLKENM